MGGLVHYLLHHLPPIAPVCPSEKMGRYNAIMMVTTTTPITTRMSGSISDSAAVNAVCTSSSKNSATEFSICGSAPVDSPTSIIDVASSGKTLVLSSACHSDLPSATPPPPVRPAFAIMRLEIDRAAVSSDGTGGMPPSSSVENVRENCATWYFNQIFPNIGIFSRIRSMRFEPLSVRPHRHKPYEISAITGIAYKMYA